MQHLDPVFEQSFRRVMSTEVDGKRFVDRFYELFTASDAAIAALFAGTHMSRQKTMLHDSLHDLVDYAASERAPRYLQQVAVRHAAAELDIPARMYALWLRSLLDTAAEFDPYFDARTADAWRNVMQPGISYMLRGGDGAAGD